MAKAKPVPKRAAAKKTAKHSGTPKDLRNGTRGSGYNKLLKKYDVIDKKYAAWHEAGHTTVAAVLCWEEGRSIRQPLDEPIAGVTELCLGSVRSHIRREHTSDPDNINTWTGSTTYGRMDLDTSDIAAISVAGIVSECLLEDRFVQADGIVEAWNEGRIEPSDTDYNGIPKSWKSRLAAVEIALKIIRGHDEFFMAIVAHLKRHMSITDGQVKDLCMQFRKGTN